MIYFILFLIVSQVYYQLQLSIIVIIFTFLCALYFHSINTFKVVWLKRTGFLEVKTSRLYLCFCLLHAQLVAGVHDNYRS